MKDRIKKTAISVKNHVKNNKVTYAVGTVAIAAIVLQQKNLADFYAFLEEKGIDKMEFVNPEYFAELQSGTS